MASSTRNKDLVSHGPKKRLRLGLEKESKRKVAALLG
jgi:hypothetical protein